MTTEKLKKIFEDLFKNMNVDVKESEYSNLNNSANLQSEDEIFKKSVEILIDEEKRGAQQVSLEEIFEKQEEIRRKIKESLEKQNSSEQRSESSADDATTTATATPTTPPPAASSPAASNTPPPEAPTSPAALTSPEKPGNANSVIEKDSATSEASSKESPPSQPAAQPASSPTSESSTQSSPTQDSSPTTPNSQSQATPQKTATPSASSSTEVDQVESKTDQPEDSKKDNTSSEKSRKNYIENQKGNVRCLIGIEGVVNFTANQATCARNTTFCKAKFDAGAYHFQLLFGLTISGGEESETSHKLKEMNGWKKVEQFFKGENGQPTRGFFEASQQKSIPAVRIGDNFSYDVNKKLTQESEFFTKISLKKDQLEGFLSAIKDHDKEIQQNLADEKSAMAREIFEAKGSKIFPIWQDGYKSAKLLYQQKQNGSSSADKDIDNEVSTQTLDLSDSTISGLLELVNDNQTTQVVLQKRAYYNIKERPKTLDKDSQYDENFKKNMEQLSSVALQTNTAQQAQTGITTTTTASQLISHQSEQQTTR